jgi:HrpA-like RNA helicase
MEAIDSAPRRPRRNSFHNKYSTDKVSPAQPHKVSITSDPATLIQEFRKELPIFDYKDDIVKTILDNNVTKFFLPPKAKHFYQTLNFPIDEFDYW